MNRTTFLYSTCQTNNVEGKPASKKKALRRWRPIFSQCIVVALVLVSLLSPRCVGAEALTNARASLLSDDLRIHVAALADDSFEGRGVGTRGGRAAGLYLVQSLKKIGLRGGAKGGAFFQPINNGGRNVLAILPGSDPKLRNQIVVIGGHYDHVGYGNSGNSLGIVGYIHNGADDNASGSAVVMEIAEALAKLPKTPKRTILFAWWDGEERGLWGSKYWLAHPTVSKKNIVLNINIDMVGRLRNKTLQVLGTRTAHGLRRIVSQQNQNTDLTIDYRWDIKSNSDHHPFFAESIPFLMLHTGLHEDYHRPGDDVHKVNFKGMLSVTRLTFDLLVEFANRDKRLSFRQLSRIESETSRREFEEPGSARPGRFGIRWEHKKLTDNGLKLTRVYENSAAKKAGLRVGDQIVLFAGSKVTNEDEFFDRVLAATNPVDVEVIRKGSDKPLKIQVNLGDRPLRLGLTWREDGAEPGTVMLAHVIPGSAAYRAGLRPGDRIYDIAGRTFKDMDELQKMASELPAPLEFQIERHGVLKKIVISKLPSIGRPKTEATSGKQ